MTQTKASTAQGDYPTLRAIFAAQERAWEAQIYRLNAENAVLRQERDAFRAALIRLAQLGNEPTQTTKELKAELGDLPEAQAELMRENKVLRDAWSAEPVAWGIIAGNTGRLCQVELDADEVADHKPQYIVPLFTRSKSWT